MPPVFKPPRPPEFQMNSLFCNLLPCDLTKEQYLHVYRIWLQHLSEQAHDEAKMYDEILKALPE